MAGSLAADVQGGDPAVLGRALARTGAPFAPRIVALDPEFQLLGGRAVDIDGRAGAAWLYRSPSSDFALGLAFRASLADVGAPDEAREHGGPALYIFRKTTQTIACWQDGPLVYALISTLPTETVIRLARRHAAPTPPTPAA
jgi:anti-sigma factor RsiW